MPVPGGRLEAEVVVRLEMAGIGPEQADDEEDGADEHVEAVEAGRHVEGRGVDAVGEAEGCVAVLVGLDAGEHRRSEEHTSELQSLMRISYAVFCLKKKKALQNA